jgi:hypothetical protein
VRRFESCRGHLVVSQDIEDARTHGSWVRAFVISGSDDLVMAVAAGNVDDVEVVAGRLESRTGAGA